ncbi:MAG: RAMP superfamily CRISPR-associated protein [Candidatus Flexifilum sp.]
MANPLWHGESSRKINKRIIVEGDLILETPAHFGSGDEMGSLVPLIVDERANQPLLTGASIAGALRSYLWTRQQGYGKEQNSKGMAALLFGGARQDDEGGQSHLIVDDAYGENAKVELRDGVKIDPKSRTAAEKKLYTFMVWSAGARFPLRFELLLTEGSTEGSDEVKLRQSLAVALSGLKNGEITLGARKRRGYGRVKIDSWRVREFDLTKPDGLIAWIREGNASLSKQYVVSDLFKALNVSERFEDRRERFTLRAQFTLDSSLLIRAGSDVADMGHLHSNGRPVLSGTSLAGAIRARALKIAKTLEIADADTLIDEMFGVFGDQDANNQDANNQSANNQGANKRTSSRVSVEEHLISDGEAERWVQSRVSIDRFTGGALDTALFDQQPQFGGRVQVQLELRSPKDKEIGLLLLVLKDLWTGDLPLGGESSVGRGRLRGETAELAHNGKVWKLTSTAGGLAIEGRSEKLEGYVQALRERVQA